jgi:hypothetical protein
VLLAGLDGGPEKRKGALIWLSESLAGALDGQAAYADLRRQIVDKLPGKAGRLLEILGDADPVIRELALTLLPTAKPDPFPEARVRQIARSDEWGGARKNAFTALALVGALNDEDVAAFRQALKSPGPNLGYDVTEFLKSLNAQAPETERLLVASFDDYRSKIPVNVWCASGGRLIKKVLKQRRGEPGFWSAGWALVQASIACGPEMEKLMRDELLGALRTVDPLGDKEVETIFAWLRAFQRWPPEELAQLATVLVERGFIARQEGRLILAESGEAGQRVLADILRNQRPSDPEKTGQILRAIGDTNPGADLVSDLCYELKGEKTPYVPSAAASALGSITGRAANQAAACLEEVFQNSSLSEGVRLAALHAIGELGPGGQVKWRLLAGSLEDPNPFVRRYAAYGLRRVNPPEEVIPLLRRALHDEDVDVRSAATAALGAFGPLARQALDEIAALENDPLTGSFARCARAKITDDWRRFVSFR